MQVKSSFRPKRRLGAEGADYSQSTEMNRLRRWRKFRTIRHQELHYR